jgi:hypothetical protein
MLPSSFFWLEPKERSKEWFKGLAKPAKNSSRFVAQSRHYVFNLR